jgi:hypothetical protein
MRADQPSDEGRPTEPCFTERSLQSARRGNKTEDEAVCRVPIRASEEARDQVADA